MKIGFFTDTYFPQISGVATSIKTLKDELEKRGHEVVIFTTTDPNALDEEEDIIRMPSIPFVSFKDRRIVVSGMMDAYIKAKDLNLDIIHTHTEFGAGMLGKYIAKRLEIPSIHTYHTMYEDYLHYIAHGKLIRPYHVKQASRTFCRHLSGIICPSDRVVQKLRQYHIYTPMAIIPTGVDLAKFENENTEEKEMMSIREEHALKDSDILLLSLSRISYEKNIQALINGMPKIVEQIPNAKLLVVGAGPYLEELEELTQKLNVTNSVVFVGEVKNENVGRYYRESDYFVNASDSESQGLTYIEAIASGTKVVAKGNAYLNHLVDDACIGRTFEKDIDFEQAFIEYQKEKIIENSEVRAQKLYEISSTNFAIQVETFYYKSQEFFEKHIVDSYEEKNSHSLHFLKKKD